MKKKLSEVLSKQEYKVYTQFMKDLRMVSSIGYGLFLKSRDKTWDTVWKNNIGYIAFVLGKYEVVFYNDAGNLDYTATIRHGGTHVGYDKLKKYGIDPVRIAKTEGWYEKLSHLVKKAFPLPYKNKSVTLQLGKDKYKIIPMEGKDESNIWSSNRKGKKRD